MEQGFFKEYPKIFDSIFVCSVLQSAIINNGLFATYICINVQKEAIQFPEQRITSRKKQHNFHNIKKGNNEENMDAVIKNHISVWFR